MVHTLDGREAAVGDLRAMKSARGWSAYKIDHFERSEEFDRSYQIYQVL